MSDRPRGPTGTAVRLYGEAMREAERNRAIIDMQAAEIAALKTNVAELMTVRCWLCRLADWVMEVRYGKPV